MKKDFAGLSSSKAVLKALTQQPIQLSANLVKVNDYGKRQERVLVLTASSLCNFKGKQLKRQIELSKLHALTVSRISPQFICHVNDEYDYRFFAAQHKETIISTIVDVFCAKTKNKLLIFMRDEVSLEPFATTKSDRKKGLTKQPVSGGILVNPQEFARILEKEAGTEIRSKNKTLYSVDQKEISMSDFNSLKLLGKGAFGTVTLAEKKDSKKLYAIKSIYKEDIIRKNQLQHTKTQKLILEHINFPFLVRLEYAFQTPSALHFVMQFMKGGQLFQHLSNARKFDQGRALFYAAEISLALGHLHSKDIIYRDIKLQNVLMDEQGHVSLTDFGMAKIIKEDETAMTFCGTPEYIAPQVLAGKGYSKAADWWSLGILLYEMIHGLPPFYNKVQSVMYKLIQEGELKFSEKVACSPATKELLTQLLKKNPQERLGRKNDVQEIKAHRAFDKINWKKLQLKEVEPPFKPEVEGSKWLQNFDSAFTKQAAEMKERPVLDPSKFEQAFRQF